MKKTFPLRAVVLSAMLTAVASALFLISFSVPLMPSFLKMDVSDLPALVGSLAMGPFWGALVCLLKNIIGLLHSGSLGVGELSNFILSTTLVVTAGLIFRRKKTRARALLASVLGALAMAAVSLPSNLFLIYPLYERFVLPRPGMILAWCQDVLPGITALWQAVLVFNVPHTFVKGLLCAALMALVYLPLRPVIEKFLKSR